MAEKLKIGLICNDTIEIRETIAYGCLNNGAFLNAVLVRAGYALVTTYPSNLKYVEPFIELEQEARNTGKGF